MEKRLTYQPKTGTDPVGLSVPMPTVILYLIKPWSKETQEGVVGEYTFYISEPRGQASEAKLVNVKFHPILVDGSYQPRFLSEKDGQHVIDRMKKSSLQIIKK